MEFIQWLISGAALRCIYALIALISEEIEKVNRHFARVEQIKQFRLLENQLSAEDEELTPTMKLKRSLVNRKCAALIDSIYMAAA